MFNRVFLIILDSFGVGEAPDAYKYNDQGSNTCKSCFGSKLFSAPNLQKLGLFNIDGIDCGEKKESVLGSYGKLQEVSCGKDTTTGHWEMSGIISETPMPTFPNGFPDEILSKIEEKWERKAICNKVYSGTDVILDYGKEHINTGNLIVYTSADSVFQIAAHEDVVPPEELYRYCKIARELLTGKYAVGRVIARPFVGEYPNFTRTSNRHDFSLFPPKDTFLNVLQDNKKKVIGVGKIGDIFAGSGLDESFHIVSNEDGMNKTLEIIKEDFNGLCFVNLVDFDSKFGHRNDVDGYANAISEFDVQLGEFLQYLKDDDMLIISADHGNDPGTPSTDHSREYIPMIAYGKNIKQNNNIGIRVGFGDIGATVLDALNVDYSKISGKSFLNLIKKD